MRQFQISTIALSEHCGPESLNPRHESLESRLSEADRYLSMAAKAGTDFVCLPESFAHHEWAEHTMHEHAEELGKGPVSSFCADWARKGRMNVVCATTILFGGKPYNTAILFDRTGKPAAWYQKVHLADGKEGEGRHLESGNRLDVFQIEGLTIGFQICYDLNFPEGCRTLALKGAELIFWPTMWDLDLCGFTEHIVKARAMENLLTIVASAYADYPPGKPPALSAQRTVKMTAVVDWAGFTLASAGTTPGLASAIVDFDRVPFHQMTREYMKKLRRPEVYEL
ncbi:MAG TPA: carbon-nitrogen hydrolase family protein [Spirochaetia bacterium]|nr:carbon-nitrogen hydrolase family protein [Spirochaetia bacterium]